MCVWNDWDYVYLNEGRPTQGGVGFFASWCSHSFSVGFSEVTVKVSNSINMIASTKMKAEDICHVGILKFVCEKGK